MKPLPSNKRSDSINLFLKLLIIIWPFLFILQGLDLTDTGYLLTGGQQVFLEPRNVQFSYILSFLINGAWGKLTEPLGLMGAYLGSAVVYICTAFLVYRSFRKLMPERILLLGLLIAMMIPNLLRYINYNNLTSLFFVAGSVILLKAYDQKSPIYYFLAGLIFGSSFYLRLPNLVSLFLFPAILIGQYFDGSGWKGAFKGVLYFVTGFFAAIVIPFLILHLFGLSGQYLETFHRLWAILTDPSSHHSGEGLVRKILTDFNMTFAAFFHSFLIIVMIGKFNDLVQKRFVSSMSIASAMFLICLIGFGVIGKTVVYHYYLLAFLGFILILQVFGFPSTGREIRFSSL
ncbi:MAG TPA: glycosyltransferase family 39 protein, partial [Synergistales bacterium]|nr:glycosyltransferase family 39 protein [Synergistales bacterium]